MAGRPTVPLLPEGATALRIPTDRPAFYDVFKGYDVLPAAAAVRLAVPPSQTPRSRPELAHVTLRRSPEEVLYAKRFAYAYITPGTGTDPVPFIRRVFRALAPDLPHTLEVFPTCGYGDATLRFGTPAEREAAMRRQPFEVDGVTVKLLRDTESVPNVPVPETDCMAHVALHDYPVEQRTAEDIEDNCRRFGVLREIDPACFTAPDLSTVRVVLELGHPREIPRELRIAYMFDDSSSVVPVQIVKVWNCAHSYDARGRYVRLFHAPA
ncbi:hypothetical protein TRIUR3_07521 [Triticum urartu]|uniref:DUF4283 domain-containing protein n=1 Tax=Triticum urartu TaxID=4572 RepID=M7ZFY0_TRIUA|nr:hypothetical protein TRIUR3_07521 [Triticum urartu]